MARKRRKSESRKAYTARDYVSSLTDEEWAELVTETRSRLRENPEEMRQLRDELKAIPVAKWAGAASRFAPP